MRVDDMQKYLTEISNDMVETKMLNAILTCFVEIKKLEERIGLIEDRFVDTLAPSGEIENAEALNSEIPKAES